MFQKTKTYLSDIGEATENLGRTGLGLMAFKEIRELLSGGCIDFHELWAKEQSRGLPRDKAGLSAIKKCAALRSYAEDAKGKNDEDAAATLAAAVTNTVFGEKDDREFVIEYAIALGYDDALCSILSAAAYSGCYARYLRAGGKIGLFSNPYLEYINVLSGIRAADSWELKRIALQNSLSNFSFVIRVLAPLDAMTAAGIFRPLPAIPDSQKLYEAVLKFASGGRCITNA